MKTPIPAQQQQCYENKIKPKMKNDPDQLQQTSKVTREKSLTKTVYKTTMMHTKTTGTLR